MTDKICIKILDPRMKEMDHLQPEYLTDGSAGVDLRAMIDAESVAIPPGGTYMVNTGLSVWIADPSLCGMILPRSGLGAKKGLVLGNLVGLIDSDYQGPLMVCLWNRSVDVVKVNAFDRIAQLVFVPVVQPKFEVVEEFPASARGEGGFGSTGTV